MTLYDNIVADLVALGAASPYPADANESDPRYKSYGVRAAGKKEVIGRYRRAMRSLPLDEKRALAHRLVESGVGEQQSVGLHILEQLVDYFTPERFVELDGLVRCLYGWSKVDAFTGSWLRDVFLRHPDEMMALARQWNVDEALWLRRTSVVLFTRKIAKSGQFNDWGLEMCERLIHDSELLVQKGVGWALKDMMRSDKERLVAYVVKLREIGVSSVITLYAIKDLKGAERTAVLAV